MNVFRILSVTSFYVCCACFSYAQSSPFYVEAELPELGQLLEQARANAPALVTNAIAQQESLARLDAAKAAYYPRFDLYSTIGGRQTNYALEAVKDENSAGANFNAVIRRPLYHWGAIEARIKQARLDQANEDLQRVLILRQIKRGLRANYLTLLINQIAIDNLRLRRQIASSQISGLGEDQKSGQLSSLDAAQLSLNQEQSLLDIEYLEGDQKRILASYKRDLGWDAVLQLDKPIPPIDAVAIIAWVEKTRAVGLTAWTQDQAEVRRRMNMVEREKAELVWVKSRQRPLINLSVSASQDQRNVGLENNVNAVTYFAGLEVTWNVFDGFETSARVRESNLRMRRYERQLEAYRAELTAQAYDVLNTIYFQARQLTLNEKRAQATELGYRSAVQDASEGRLSAQSLRERQLNAREYSLNVLRTRITLLLALNDYLDLTLPAAIELPASP
jgi:outer membrane protein TolC